MRAVFQTIELVQGSNATVLITGESGTGKELVARALHRHSPRAAKPFIALNTSAFTADLLESELFGHEKGAFTGAAELRRGRFEQADGGTLFLDEIGDMSPALQTRLLRVLAEGEFYRVGGQNPVKVDVRVIAATHQDLEERVKQGLFREDLLHRLNVIRIGVPPLRQRREDIPELLQHYLDVAALELGVAPKVLTPEAQELLLGFDWPGNVRQLVNACRRLTVLAAGREITREDIPADLGGGGGQDVTGTPDWAQSLAGWARQRLAAGEQPLLAEGGLPQELPEEPRLLADLRPAEFRLAERAVPGRRHPADEDALGPEAHRAVHERTGPLVGDASLAMPVDQCFDPRAAHRPSEIAETRQSVFDMLARLRVAPQLQDEAPQQRNQ
jgi:two-component system nitrogen regulation response regulator GlnG